MRRSVLFLFNIVYINGCFLYSWANVPDRYRLMLHGGITLLMLGTLGRASRALQRTPDVAYVTGIKCAAIIILWTVLVRMGISIFTMFESGVFYLTDDPLSIVIQYVQEFVTFWVIYKKPLGWAVLVLFVLGNGILFLSLARFGSHTATRLEEQPAPDGEIRPYPELRDKL